MSEFIASIICTRYTRNRDRGSLVFYPRTRHHTTFLNPTRQSLKLILTRQNEFLLVVSYFRFFFFPFILFLSLSLTRVHFSVLFFVFVTTSFYNEKILLCRGIRIFVNTFWTAIRKKFISPNRQMSVY